MISSGKLRIDGALVNKPHRAVQIGHVYTFAQGPHIRVIKVLGLATRRGPAPEAALLYEDMAPIEPRQKQDGASLSAGTFAPDSLDVPGSVVAGDFNTNGTITESNVPYTYYHPAAFNVSRVFPLGGPLGGTGVGAVALPGRGRITGFLEVSSSSSSMFGMTWWSR